MTVVLDGGNMAHLTISQIVKRYNVPRTTVWHWVNTGQITGAEKANPYAKTSRLVIPEESVEEFFSSREPVNDNGPVGTA